MIYMMILISPKTERLLLILPLIKGIPHKFGQTDRTYNRIFSEDLNIKLYIRLPDMNSLFHRKIVAVKIDLPLTTPNHGGRQICIFSDTKFFGFI